MLLCSWTHGNPILTPPPLLSVKACGKIMQPDASSQTETTNAYNCSACVQRYSLPQSPCGPMALPSLQVPVAGPGCRASPFHRCGAPGCNITFLSAAALRRHTDRIHPDMEPAPASSPLSSSWSAGGSE